MSDTEIAKETEMQDKQKLRALGSDDSSSDAESDSEANGVSESSTENSVSERKGVIKNSGSVTDDTDDEEGALENDGAVESAPSKATMDSLSSDTEEDCESRNEPRADDVHDGVSIKSKIAPAAYDDDDNFDDLLADLPEDEGATPGPVIKEPEEKGVNSDKEDAREATPEPKEEEQDEEVSVEHTKSPSPLRSPSPDQDLEIGTRSPSPERKDSRGSHGSSSYDDERASSLSPEPPKVIAAPASKVTSPLSPHSPGPQSSSQARASPITKIYTDKITTVDSDNEETGGKAIRQKPAGDITQIYTQKLATAQESPKPDRAKFVRPSRDITQLYTAALHKEDKSPSRVEGLPKRTGDITKLYTGGLGAEGAKAFRGKPNDERTNPTKHNMSTAMDKDAIKEAYTEVMADSNGIEWATFIFKDNKLGVTAKGSHFNEFKSQFGPDDRGFGYIKIMTGDEMSKRSKFVMVTWVGPNVSVMKKAKMSTDKALMKDIIQNLSVEMQCENANEISEDRFKTEVVRAGGANYGTGVRDK